MGVLITALEFLFSMAMGFASLAAEQPGCSEPLALDGLLARGAWEWKHSDVRRPGKHALHVMN